MESGDLEMSVMMDPTSTSKRRTAQFKVVPFNLPTPPRWDDQTNMQFVTTTEAIREVFRKYHFRGSSILVRPFNPRYYTLPPDFWSQLFKFAMLWPFFTLVRADGSLIHFNYNKRVVLSPTLAAGPRQI
jgi:hypothetical protein